MKLFFAIAAMFVGLSVQAAEENAMPALSGYDPVTYFTENAAVRGSGMHASEHEGQMYLFANEGNKKEFAKSPSKYLPQFGGYCAYGAAKGKKFFADPTIFAVVGGKLYLNLDKDIQGKWNAEQATLIKDGEMEWKKIRSKKIKSL